jgi:hypothetical protein
MSRKAKWQMLVIATVIVALGAAAPFALAKHGKHKNHTARDQNHRPSFITAFGTMYGVDGPFINPANAIRGIIGDEAAWKLSSARGFLSTDGHLKIQVRGLIFGDGTPNDEPTFRGAVSCLTEDEAAGTTPTANVFTDGFPATPEGDSDIDAHVTLPNPCVAPVIFVLAGSEDKWFSVTGFESTGVTTPGGDDGDDDQGENNDDQGDDD